MKIIKINFVNFWEGYDNPNDFLRVLRFLRNDYIFELSDHPDFIIYSNGCKREDVYLKNVGVGVKTIFIEGEYIPSIDMNQHQYAFTCLYNDHPNHFRIPYYTHFMNCAGIDFNHLIKKEKLDRDNFVVPKKFCNFIYSNKVKFREYFFRMLDKKLCDINVDAPGKSMNNMPELYGHSDIHRFHSYKNDFQRQYKFSIAFENDRSDMNNGSGYTTEKLTDPMLVNSIPIYWGDPDVGKTFNTKSFVNVRDYTKAGEIDFEVVFDKIYDLDIDDNEYFEMLNEPWLINNKLPDHMNNEVLREKFKNIFG